ncbi:hypothetical protein OPQ81_002361 [Rhizoctonia solani]|nr:hypothetical protein OPQ81_002361 [Rhizoctonia solani]
MPSHPPGAGPGWVSPHAHRLDSGYVSLDRLATVTNVDYVPSSNIHCDFVTDNDRVVTSAIPNRPNDVHPGRGAVAINASLRLQLESSGLLDPPNPFDGPAVPGIVSFAVALFPDLLRAPSSAPAGVIDPRGSELAVDEDDIATEHILTRAPPAGQECPHSRFFPRPIPIFDSSRFSPVPAPTNPAPTNPAPNRRAFSIPLPIFDIPPTVELPPSRDSSLISVPPDEDQAAEFDQLLSEIGSWSHTRQSYSGRINLKYSISSDFTQVTRVNPLYLHHPRPVAFGAPNWVQREISVKNNYSHSVFSGSSCLSFQASTSNGTPYENSFLATSTPVCSYTETPSFDYNGWGAPATGNMDVDRYFANVTGSSHVLEYPSDDLPSGNDISGTFAQSLDDFPFSFNHTRTGTLPPHPPGFLPQAGQTRWLQSLPCFDTFPSFDHSASHYQGTIFGLVEHSTMSCDFENSTFVSSTESSASHTEIVGDRPGESPFGPAIHPEQYQSASPSISANEPTRPTRIRPLSDAYITYGARTDIFSPVHQTAEDETSVDESTPPTPSPPSHALGAQHILTLMNAYSHPTESPAFFPAAPEDTLPPLDHPENPNEITLPSIEHVLGSDGSEEVDQSKGPGRVHENEVSEVVHEGEVFGVVGRGEAVNSGAVVEVVDESEVSEDGNEGDDEDETDEEDEYDQYFSTTEDESADFAYPRYALASGSQYSVLEHSGSDSSPFFVDHYSENEGSAHSDDGYVFYTTDEDAA